MVVDPQREVGPPSEGALRWVAESIAPGASVTSVRRLTGGVTSAMHAITVVETNGRHHRSVLRRWIGDHPDNGPECVYREARVLESLERTDIPAPRVLGVDPDGGNCGDSALLMSYLDGHVELTPSDPEDWLQQITEMLVRIHNTTIEAPVAESWLNRDRLVTPEWSTRPDLWREAFSVIEETAPISESCFIHHDYQQFNLMWRRGTLTSVVDWVWGSWGAPSIDLAHLRLNLSVLYSSELAERFLNLYESMSGRRVERWWDIEGLLKYLPGWGEFLQQQAGRRLTVDFEGMHERVEATLESALRHN
jgi:aminoglycoside phosphotransferase (APT) family kinase protein